MPSLLTRATAVAAAALLLVPAVAGAAVDEHAAEASTSAVTLSVFENAVGDPVLDLLTTDAVSSSDPMASGTVGLIEVLGQSVGDARDASSSDATQAKDPESGDGCILPVQATGLTIDVVCTTATATAGAAGATEDQEASASAQLVGVDVDGSLVSALLTQGLADFVADLTDELSDGAVAAVITAFSDECDLFLASVPDPLNQIPNTTAELIQAIEDASGAPLPTAITDAIAGNGPCSAILALSVEDIVDPVLTVAPIADALAGIDLIEIVLDGASSTITGVPDDLTADAEQVFVSITGPSLNLLDDALTTALTTLYADFEAAIFAVTGEALPDDFDFTGEIAAALDQIPIFGSADPLLTAVVSGGSASANLDLSSGATAGSGNQPYITVSIAPGVAALVGAEGATTVTLQSGETLTIGAGTPIESSLSVGALTVNDDATFEDTGLGGSEADVSATTVSLLTGVEGGIVLTLAASRAAVYGSLAPVTPSSPDPSPDPDPLPNTGGGAALAALAALGAAVAVRRRRD